MPQSYEAYDAKTGRHWDWNGNSWIPREEQKSTVKKVWDAASQGLVSSDTIAKGMDPEFDEKAKERFISEGHPIPAAIAAFTGGAKKSTSDLLSSFTSPISLALTAATAGEGAAAKSGLPVLKNILKILQTGAGVGFGGQGAWNAIQKKQPGETTPDEIQRRLMGLSQGVFGAAGAYKGTEIPRKLMAREGLGVSNRAVEIANKEALDKSVAGKVDYSLKVSDKKAEFDAKQAEKQAQYDAKKAAAQAKTEADTAAMKKGYGESVARTDQAKLAASKLETTKRSLSDLKDRLSQQAAENITQAEKAEKATIDRGWDQFRDDMKEKGGTVDWTPVQNEVVNAEENILKGSPENIALFRNIMKEGDAPLGLEDASVFRGRPGVDVKEFLSSIRDPIQKDRFIQEMRASGADMSSGGNMPREGATVPFDQARGFYTELGRKLYGSDLPGDVYRAIKSVQDSVDKQNTNAIETSLGKEGVERYKTLKSDFSDYMRTWRDMRPLSQGGSPLARIIQLTEAPLAVKDKMSVYRDVGNQILQKAGDRVSYLLSRKKGFGADPTLAARIRATDQQLRALPKSGPKIPEVKRPDFPTAKEIPEPQKETFTPPEEPPNEPFSAEEWRRKSIQDKSKYLGSRLSGWDIIFPPRLALERMLSRALTNPGILDWLSKD